MREIKLVTDLSWIDRLIYRFVLIPITKKRLLEREEQFAWIYRQDFPDWGRGRDDAMNLTKYFMLKLPMDDSVGPDRHAGDLEPEEVRREGHDDEPGGRQPRRLLGHHRLGARRRSARRRRTRTSSWSR